jgi:hypothetical protein
MFFKLHPVRLNVMGEYYCNIDVNTETETAIEKIPYCLILSFT